MASLLRILTRSCILSKESFQSENYTPEYDCNEITPAHIRQIGYELGIVQTCWPEILSPVFENRTHLPESYYRNSEKEKFALVHAENFRQQFKYLYPHRRPLVLAAENGCGLQKLVCNTIRPTSLPYLELKDWKGCAQFVADYINYEILERPTLPPERILGPYTVVSRQLGNCYEMATVLCSLLLGVGYHAFVVSGYATEDITTYVRYRTKCPIKTELPAEEVVEEEYIENKYKLREIRDLRSQFILYMAQRELDWAEQARQRQIEKERLETEEREKAPKDELEGWRVHAWVLLLPKYNVKEPTFIEPSTGISYPTSTDVYLSVESIWNTDNYWVNLQDCSNGLGHLKWELTDLTCWEHLFIGEPLEHRTVQLDPDAEVDEKTALDEKHLDVPTPWSEPIHIPHEKFVFRFANGVKKTKFNRCILLQYGDYIQFDGLKHKLFHYSDFECNDLIRIEDTYEHRLDHLTSVISDVKSNMSTEYFQRGREDACKFHTYNYLKDNTMEAARTLEFYYDFRLDGLCKLEMDPLFLKETFKNREDNLYFRHAIFAERGKPPPGMVEGTRRIVMSVTEKYHRDPSKDAHHDIAVRIFDIVENSIHLKFHYAKGHVTATTQNFIKPKVADRNDELQFNIEFTSGYQAEIGAKPPKQLELYYLMIQQMKIEQKTLYHLREIEDEVAVFVRTRAIENAVPQLNVSLFNREQNEEYKAGLKEKEEQQRMHEEREVDEDIDYLSPYLVRIGASGKNLEKAQIAIVKEDCLREFKELLTTRANTLRSMYEKQYQEYLNKQQWFSNNMSMLNMEEEEKTLSFISHKKYLLHLYYVRLERHIELSNSRYRALVDYLNANERLQLHHQHQH